MVARGSSRRKMSDCGCTIRAMAAVDDDGKLQALVCTENVAARDGLCLSCQQICHTLNAALAARSFSQAAGLTREHFCVDADAGPHLALALAALHEAMLEAVLEFESKGVAELEYMFRATDQQAEPAVALA